MESDSCVFGEDYRREDFHEGWSDPRRVCSLLTHNTGLTRSHPGDLYPLSFSNKSTAARLSFPTMKIVETFLLCVFGAPLLCGTWGTSKDELIVERDATTIARCEDIPVEADLGGELLIDGRIDCPESNMKVR